ncbi:Putative Flp pilus-assembly TadE/G-like [Thalassobacillus cyri]|uniref:Putative Flp pilus-assembly TadE/G-like n=1 Tax=Thalassobacillus cyri TaxID=571932 RepID=A0A1H4EG68_9BACI|nr:pilus assembly protein TadG-related protein [Thalassobacillus cyri]SEA83837.1 Putative Flp pilus-assembly TadE/G-like [Thalassobacillus cyri]
MKHFFKRIFRKEKGNVIVLVALALGGMITLLGLVIDGGHLFMTKSHLQKTANAAALSGAQELLNDKTAVRKVVDELLEAHGESGSLVEPFDPIDQVHVKLKRDVPLFFSSLFGVEYLPIAVEAKAGLNPMGETKGAVPLGIDESVDLQYGDIYQLKVDAGDSEAGNFGVLALEGPGAKSYEESLTYGFEETLKVGDVINTQTGNIAGATRKGIDYRIGECPNPEGDIQKRDCPRIMKVIVYKLYEQATNQMKSVQITGFAYFYVTERMGANDDSIKGIFIRRAGDGTAGAAGTPDRGAYAIRLTE